MPNISVAVVVPTLNEADRLPSQLAALTEVADEVVVSDGGSDDGTVEVAREWKVRCLHARRGRGPQMNRGAAATRADVLLFLHADTRLPSGAVDAVRQAIGTGAVGGGFLVRFDLDTPLFRLGAKLVNLRTRWTRIPLGDQAQFVRRDAFADLGGFPDWPILEDLDLMRRLRRRGRIALVPRPVVTSARRYTHHGTFRTIANNWWIWLLFFLGVSPERLAARYRNVR